MFMNQKLISPVIMDPRLFLFLEEIMNYFIEIENWFKKTSFENDDPDWPIKPENLDHKIEVIYGFSKNITELIHTSSEEVVVPITKTIIQRPS